MTVLDPERQAARLRLVEEHIGHENRHDLEGIMSTFGANARYEDEPWGDRHVGYDGVRSFYADLLRAMPDLTIEVQRRYADEAAVVLEVIIRGRPPRRLRRCAFILCGFAARHAGPHDRSTAALRRRGGGCPGGHHPGAASRRVARSAADGTCRGVSALRGFHVRRSGPDGRRKDLLRSRHHPAAARGVS